MKMVSIHYPHPVESVPTVCIFTNLDFAINCVAYGKGEGTSLPVPSRFCDTEHCIATF